MKHKGDKQGAPTPAQAVLVGFLYVRCGMLSIMRLYTCIQFQSQSQLKAKSVVEAMDSSNGRLTSDIRSIEKGRHPPRATWFAAP